MIPIAIRKHIPWVKTYTSKKAKILWALTWIFVPSNLTAMFLELRNQQELQMIYNINFERFSKYQRNKDVEQINDDVEFVDI